MSKRLKTLAAACAVLAVAACSPAEPAPAAPPSKLLWMGDSVAEGLAGPLAAAAQAGGLSMESIASTGGGNVSGIEELTKSTWDQLTGKLGSFDPDVVAYQVSTYDWGTEGEQLAAYEKLLATVTAAGATLVFVTMPPIKADEFYAPHLAELQRTGGLVRRVADGSGGKAVVLDSAAVWGPEYRLDRDGKRDRSPDGIHTCPQGAARFTAWLLGELAARFPGFTPAAPESWANAGWAGGPAFRDC
ncbi:SGNH/GDSL hydrolase family protein [Amycolatopsis sp. 195334CR]|uniref:SGNH/GDSL hydrolase family protein n=1 Tax=Amycolatopsis sp. 195334CR TaxID=2814588 RepID=UPI001F5CF194|nr:SGNH/GDSL hydrolase family protein [Amycolatopsis sp. 195334CR]